MTQSQEAMADYYGVQYSGTLVDASYHQKVSGQMTLSQVSMAGGKITRVRRLAEMGRVDTSYIHATLPDGSIVSVYVNIGNLVPLRYYKRELIRWAQRENVYAKGLGLLDESVWSTLY